jgi:hypothetical protein
MQPPAAPQADPLLVAYLPDCVLLRAVARALALPAPVAAAALAYLHRTRRSGTPWALGREDLVCGCLYVAAKAEEVRARAAAPHRQRQSAVAQRSGVWCPQS